ncbi:hypothetical protein ACFYYB_14245 [Streptomyces sp. NPDC002886]|uniref:Imm32 family immunity protein n=1 Tax=Streptomyces sp. NPDC002886 TaxID=3364667 RepID=UPI00369C9D1F
MRVLFFPGEGGVDLSGSASELVAVARALSAGGGVTEASASTEPSFGGTELTSVEVLARSGSGVRVGVDPARRALLIEGDRTALGALADELRSTAEMEDGGHQHIEYYPGHDYLAAGSLAMVLNSPHGGMPAR